MSDFEKARLDELASGPAGPRHLDAQTVQAEVSRIRASRFFRHSPRLARFLAFTVEKTLAGSAGDLKEYLIGVEVYGRRAGFDPKADSIVRSEAVRLRHRLRQYYEVEGAQNALRISFPKGGYVPAFEPHAAPDAPDRAAPRTCNTIAVLPFVNVGGSAHTQAFGEGLADELICGLGRAPGFRVVARRSSFAFQGKAVDVREAGRRLHAEAVLEGTVRCWRGQVRVTAQLVDVATGLHLWSERFDRTLDHLFALQDEIARRIVSTLGGTLTRAVRAPAEPESYRLYLKGRLHWARYSLDGAERSCAFYERALEASPQYAAAWAGLAFPLLFLSHRGRATTDNADRARRAIDTALAIDETLPDAHAARALLLGFIDRNWAEAERSVRKALQLAPGDAGILHQAGVCLLITGQFDEAGTLIRRAADLDPLAPHYQMDLGILLRVQGRHDDAIEQFRAALEIDPNHRESLWQLGLALQQAGRFDEALASFGRATIDPDEELPAMGTTGHCYAVSGRPEVAQAMLERLESAQGQEAAAMLYARALIHVALGEHEPALACLERCAALSTSRLVLLKYDWRFTPLARQARFDAILSALGSAPS